jgi:CHAD domain-containing protein
MREREMKLLAASDLELPAPEELLDGVGSWTVEEIELVAVYFDTSDLRLTRAGVSLRYRSDDGWTVKLPEPSDGEAFVRNEHVFAGELGEPPSAAAELVRVWVRSSQLGQVARISTHRRTIHIYDDEGRDLGEIDDDTVSGTSTRHHAFEFREIEVENAEDADPAALKAVVKRIRAAGAGTARPMPKIARALGAAASMPPDLCPPEPLEPNATLGQLVQAAIASSVQRLVDHDPVIRVSDHPEGIHQARVATRRLRSDLRTFRPVLDPRWSEPLRAELKWLGEELGRVRDADVLLEHLEEKSADLRDEQQTAASELIERLRNARVRDRDQLLDAMRSDRYAALLDRLIDATRAPRFKDGKEDVRAAKVVRRLTRRPWKRLRKAVARLPEVPKDTQLHEVRKRTKQSRYALEAVTPITGSRTKQVAKRLADLQDVLGDHQDAVVASQWLHDAALDSSGSEPAFVAGLLAGSFAADRREQRGRWHDVWKRAARAHRAL